MTRREDQMDPFEPPRVEPEHFDDPTDQNPVVLTNPHDAELRGNPKDRVTAVAGGTRGPTLPPVPPGTGQSWPIGPNGPDWRRERILPPDALAFYWSFRNRYAHPFLPGAPWGIFVFESSIEYLASFFDSVTAGGSPDDLRQLALEVLVAHELFHFQVDLAARRMEELVRRVEGRRFPLYERHRKHCPRRVLTGYDPLEEALANAFALSRVDRSLRRPTRAFMRRQPEGYRDFGLVSRSRGGGTEFGRRIDQLMTEMAHFKGIPGGIVRIDRLGGLRHDDDHVYNGEDVPVWMLHRSHDGSAHAWSR